MLGLLVNNGFCAVPVVMSVLSQPGEVKHLTAQTTHAVIPEGPIPLFLRWEWSREEGLVLGNEAAGVTANRPF